MKNRIIIVSTILLLLSFPALSQRSVNIQGQLKGYNDNAIIYFMNADELNGAQFLDSVKLKNDYFKKRIYITEPVYLGMVISPNGKSIKKFSPNEKKTAENIAFYIDGGQINLEFDSTFRAYKLNPINKINLDFQQYYKIISSDRKMGLDSINGHYSIDGKINENGTMSVKSEEIENYKFAIHKVEEDVLNKLSIFAAQNSSSYIGLLSISKCFNMRRDLAPRLIEIFNNYTTELKNTTLGKKLRIELELYK